MEIWMRWMRSAYKKGPIAGLNAVNGDYPPLSLAVLWGLEHVARFAHFERHHVLKVSLWLCLAVTCCVFWLSRRSRFGPTKAILWTGLVGWSLLLNSVALGYLDVWFAPFLLGTLHYLEKRVGWSAALLFSISALFKWQPLVLAPLVGALLVTRYRRGERSNLVWFGAISVVVLVFCVTLYGSAFGRAFMRAMGHQFISGNATNFGWLVTHVLHVFFPESYGPLDHGLGTYVVTKTWQVKLLPRLVFATFYAWALWRAFERELTLEKWLRLALAGYLAYFTFNVGVHENHLFIAVLLAAFAASRRAVTLTEFALVAAGLNLNLLIFYGVTGEEVNHERVIGGIDMALVASCIWVAWAGWWLVRELTERREIQQ